jgi:hypothetical protein
MSNPRVCLDFFPKSEGMAVPSVFTHESIRLTIDVNNSRQDHKSKSFFQIFFQPPKYPRQSDRILTILPESRAFLCFIMGIGESGQRLFLPGFEPNAHGAGSITPEHETSPDQWDAEKNEEDVARMERSDVLSLSKGGIRDCR